VLTSKPAAKRGWPIGRLVVCERVEDPECQHAGGIGIDEGGEVNYTRTPDDTFMQFAWFACGPVSWMSSAIDARREQQPCLRTVNRERKPMLVKYPRTKP